MAESFSRTQSANSEQSVVSCYNEGVRYRKAGSTDPWKFRQTANTYKTLKELTPGTTYQYQLKYRCPDGWKSWGPTYQFTTAP